MKKLIIPLSDKMNIQYYVTDDKLFDVIDRRHREIERYCHIEAHREYNHGDRDHTVKALINKYANVTKDCINFYLNLCVQFQKRKSF